MRKGSFSVQKAKAHSSKHNSREQQPKYLIDSSGKNYYELIIEDEHFIEQAKLKYKETVKQNMQKKQIPGLIKETVLTIQKHQNENDIKSLFKELNKEFGGHHLTEVSIHRDEGYFLKDDIAYYPTKNILRKDDNWYVCSDTSIEKPKKSDFNKLVKINEFQKVYNYHAHAKFSMFDMETGKTARMNKSQMSKRIKFVSNYLDLDYNPNRASRHVRKSVNQVKDEHLVKANEKSLELAKQKDLKLEVAKLREELKELKAERTDYASLEELNRSLKDEVRKKTLTVKEMNCKIESLKKELLLQKKQNSSFQEEINHLEDSKAMYQDVFIDTQSKIDGIEKILDDVNLKNTIDELSRYEINMQIDNNEILSIINKNSIERKTILGKTVELNHDSFVRDFQSFYKKKVSNSQKGIDRLIKTLKSILDDIFLLNTYY